MTASPRYPTHLALVPRCVLVFAVIPLAACDSGPSEFSNPGFDGDQPLLRVQCRLTPDLLQFGGVGRDGIPALVSPLLVPTGDPGARYLDEYLRQSGAIDAPEPRVVGLVLDGTPVAIPHNILWWHEIVHLDRGGRRLAITYCPLTGSALVFDATAAGTNRFGVSGLLFQNNLVMFDEETESLWPQMCAVAAIGSRQGTELVQVAAIEMRWAEWKTRYPETLVVSSETGFDMEYLRYPYGSYETNEFLLFGLAEPVDTRLHMKDRVFGIPEGDGGGGGGGGGLAIPFDELVGTGTAVIRALIGGQDVLVLWDDAALGAAAFRPETTDGVPVVLQPDGTGFVDRETGTRWNVEGFAVDGPMEGARLASYPGAVTAFWFAWSAFHPATRIWGLE